MTTTTAAVTTTDILSALFFIIAGIWLVVAVVYSLLVLYFIRLRSRNLLHTIYEDPEFGRWYLFRTCGCCSNASSPWYHYYIPFGCILRRYARHLNLEPSASSASAHRKHTSSERRQAMMRLLILQPSSSPTATTNPCPKKLRHWQWIWKKERKDVPLSLSEDGASSCCSTSDLELGVHPEQCRENGGDNEDSPLCSICLASLDDPEDAFDENDAIPNSGNICASRHSPKEKERIRSTTGRGASIPRVFRAPTCRHVFHTDCILDWLQIPNHIECPCCRVALVPEDDVWGAIQDERRKRRRSQHRSGKKKQKQQRNSAAPLDATLNETEDASEYGDEPVIRETARVER